MYTDAPPALAAHTDVYPIHAPSEPPESAPESRFDAARDEAEACNRSKTEPSNVVLPQTLAWAAALPDDIRPLELLRSFGPIANLLARQWDEPAATRHCFTELLVKRRKDRKEFQPEVRDELIALQLHYLLYVEVERFCARDNVTKQ